MTRVEVHLFRQRTANEALTTGSYLTPITESAVSMCRARILSVDCWQPLATVAVITYDVIMRSMAARRERAASRRMRSIPVM